MVDQQVRRLDVAVHTPLGMGVRQRISTWMPIPAAS
jgi:hypothetical protein